MARRSTRTAKNDDIEVDQEEVVDSQNISQPADEEVESAQEDGEVRPARRSIKANATKPKSKVVKVKIEKTTKSRTRRNASDDEAPDGDASQAPFDKVEFLATPRPIPPKGADTISGIISDLQIVVDRLDVTGFELVNETAVAVEEVSGNTEEGRKTARKLDLVMRQIIDAQHELKAHQESLETLKQGILQQDIMGNLEDLYTKDVSDAIQTYKSRTSRQKYMKHKEYIKFRELVWEVNSEGAMPPLGELIPKEDGDSDDDSDIEVGGVTQNYKCPLTLQLMTDPLTSKKCGHSFSANGITEYITGNRGRATCPATGCNAVITMADLERNEELAHRVANAERRAARREEDSDGSDAEVID